MLTFRNIYNCTQISHFLRIIYVFPFRYLKDGDGKNLPLDLKCLNFWFHNTHNKNLTYFKFFGWLIQHDFSQNIAQRFAAWRSGGLSVLNFANINKTLIEKQTFQKSTKPRHFAKLLLADSLFIFVFLTLLFLLSQLLFYLFRQLIYSMDWNIHLVRFYQQNLLIY